MKYIHQELDLALQTCPLMWETVEADDPVWWLACHHPRYTAVQTVDGARIVDPLDAEHVFELILA